MHHPQFIIDNIDLGLIALVYLQLHVYKLYPKQYCGEGGLQRAMCGSLCSYLLNMEKMIDMVEGNMMPRRPEVLPSFIAVLYIGVGKLPMELLKNLQCSSLYPLHRSDPYHLVIVDCMQVDRTTDVCTHALYLW